MKTLSCQALLLFSALLLSGCGPKFMPTFKPQVGDKRTIEQNSYLTMGIQVMGQSMPMNVTNTSRWTCEVTEVDTAGAVTLQVTVDEVQSTNDMFSKMPGGGIDLSFLDKARAAMKGKSFKATVTPDGQVLRLEGAEDLAKAATSGVTLPTTPMPGMDMKDMITQSFGEPMLRKTVESWMTPYQAVEAKAGTTWEKRGADTMEGMTLNFTLHCTVTEVGDGVAKMTFEKKYEPGGGEMAMGPMKMRMEPQGGATGTIEMETETGWITAMYSDEKMTSKMTMEGMPGGMGGEMSLEMTGNSALKTLP